MRLAPTPKYMRQVQTPKDEEDEKCVPSGHAVVVFPMSSTSMLVIRVGFARFKTRRPRSMPGGASARRPRRRPVASPARRKTTDSASRMSRAFLWGVGLEDVGMNGMVCGGRQDKDEGTRVSASGSRKQLHGQIETGAVPRLHFFAPDRNFGPNLLILPFTPANRSSWRHSFPRLDHGSGSGSSSSS